MAQILTQVRLGTLSNINVFQPFIVGIDKIDDVIVYSNDRILVKSQTDRKENGIYVVGATGNLSRSSDFALNSAQTPSSIVFIQEGSVLSDTGWVLSTDASDNSITVGTDDILFERFSLNLNILGADLPSSIVLRSEKGYPLTINELDNNFKYLSVSLTEKLNRVDFTQRAVCDLINSVEYSVSAIDANRLQTFEPKTEVVENISTIALRTPEGNINSITFTGDLIGNADSSTLAEIANTAHVLDQVNPVQFGGTGGSTAAQARSNLAVLGTAGGSMTGKLILVPAESSFASLNIPAQASAILNPQNGDVWSSTAQLFYKLSGNIYTIASLESPVLTGAPRSPTPEQSSNSEAIATTQFVQGHVSTLNQSINLKANIQSPSLTGEPKSTTPDTTDTSTRIATTQFTANKITAALGNYLNTSQVNSAISTALEGYYTKPETDQRISNAVTPKANKSYVDDLQDKWGTSRKFVQSTAPSNAVDGDFWFKV